MAIDLSTLTRPSGDRPVICTILADAGLGKTTLAATFPAPVFIRTEDGTASLVGHEDAALFDIAASSQDVFDQIEALATQEHDRKTLVLDSITQLAAIIEQEIVASDPKARSMATAMGGYGAGYNAASLIHAKVRDWAGSLSQERNMNVVFIAHADTETMDMPDMDPYSRYTVRMHKKCLPHYVDNVDLVAQIRLKTFIRGEDGKKRAVSTGEREIVCHAAASSITKNRFGITESMSFDAGENPFDQYVAK